MTWQELEIGVLLAERRDAVQGALLRVPSRLIGPESVTSSATHPPRQVPCSSPLPARLPFFGKRQRPFTRIDAADHLLKDFSLASPQFLRRPIR